LAESPLGPKVGGRSEGYSFEAGKAAPYHSYFYQILTAQGPHAEGGAVNYLVNHAGAVHQKDLGPKTASLAKAMTRFDPDSSWARAEP
jgi:Protein of unknown function (DUF2950)